MAAEDFFNRWGKRKIGSAESAADSVMPTTSTDAASQSDSRLPVKNTPFTPTLDDVAQLTRDSDYTPFVARGVDETVRRSAMKKLFADPRFNIMDGLDVYIDDYHTFDPISAEMLAALNHGKALLDPLRAFEKPLSQIIDDAMESQHVSEGSAAYAESNADVEVNLNPEAIALAPSPTMPHQAAASADAEKNRDSKNRSGAAPVSDDDLLDSV